MEEQFITLTAYPDYEISITVPHVFRRKGSDILLNQSFIVEIIHLFLYPITTQLLNFLSNAYEKTLNRIMTLDEIWLYLNNPRKSMWIVLNKKAPVNLKQNIGTKKYMISVICVY